MYNNSIDRNQEEQSKFNNNNMKAKKELIGKKTFYFIFVIDCFNALPSLDQLLTIVKTSQYSKKECFGIKLTLDLWEAFFKKFSDSYFDQADKKDKKSYIPNLYEFYEIAYKIFTCFSKEDIEMIYYDVSIKSKFLSNLKKQKSIVCFDKKEEYLIYYLKQKKEIQQKNKGLFKEKFVL